MKDSLLQENTIREPYEIVFINDAQQKVGRLVISDKIKFEGNADESAKLFFDYLDKNFELCKEQKNDK